MTFTPLTDSLSPTGRRRAVCRAGRPSEALTDFAGEQRLIALQVDFVGQVHQQVAGFAVIRFFE
jgi:hypothetical protein